MFVDIVALVPGFNLPFPFGTLYASSSDGSYFTASLHNTNRDLSTGLVDFEHIQATMHEGVLLANTVKNWEDIVNRNTMFKQLSTKMSFDNGRTWSLISPPAKDSKGNTFGCSPSGEQDDNCALHLHSVTTSRNVGRVFSVSSAPGIIIGVGNVGPNLLSYSDCDTFLSDDSGVTWREIQKGSHKFEIMNFGSTLVLVPDGDMTVSYIIYSKDRGKKWEKYELKIKGNDWVPRFTAIDPSSKSRKILIYAVKIPTDRRHYFVQLDFESLFSRKCDSNDLETWVMKGKGDYCVLGTTWEYRRRKENADCYMGQDFKAVPKMGNPCRCTDSDYECDLGFARVEAQEKVNCISVNTANDQPADCKIGSTYKGLSGYRFIPGTRCRGGNDKLGEPITKECKNIPGSGTPPGEPKKSTFEFDAHIVEIAEIPSTSIVYVLLDNAQVWRSKDFGVSWKRLEFPDKEPVFKFILHESELNRLVFMSTKRIFFAKDDKIDELPAINELKVPEEFNVFGIPVLDIHPTEPEWYAFVGGGSDCATATSCHSTAYITKDSGKKWSKVQTWVTHCAWAHDIYFDVGTIPKDAVFCTTFKNKPTNIGQDKVPVSDSNSLVFEKIVDGKSETLLDNNVLQFFVDYNYVLVATGNENAPSLYSSTDGVKFELIQFPPGVVLDQKSITLLESNSTGIFASFKGHTVSGEEYGNLLKSSVNGLYFSKLIGAVNQNSNGVTDFQKIPGSFLTLLSNIVTNPKSIRTQGKTITSVISHDGGVTWSSLIPPKFDSSGKGINCESKSDCSLHLNLRADSTAFGKMLNPYGSESTAGVFLGVGNWGNKLIEYDRGNLYITSDYGHNFTEVAKGPHLWTFAEHGSLIVAVEDIQYVDSLKYSWNYGKSWATLKFASTAIRIELIVGFEKHAQVLLTGHTQMGTKTVVYQLDFKNLYQRQCDESDIESAEFSSNLCIMGTKYLIRRRKPSSTCSLGLQFNSLVKTNDLCECAESDYECIDKYFRNEIGQCSPLGNDPYQPADCKNGTVYQGKSGYQKLKLDTCIKGQDLTKPVDRKCGEDPTGPDMIRIKTFKFDDQIDDYFYFKSSTNIIAKDIQHNAYLTKDEGATWTKIDTTDRIVSIMEDESFSDRAFMFTEEPIIYMMMDRGENILKLNVQGVTNLNVAPTSLITHPTKKDWMIWIGAQNCKIGEEYCHTAGQVSWDSGKTWNEFDKYVKYCVWAQSAAFHSLSEQSFFCSVSVTQTGDQRSFTNYDLKRYDSGSTKGESILKINAFAIESQYLIASIVNLVLIRWIYKKEK